MTMTIGMSKAEVERPLGSMSASSAIYCSPTPMRLHDAFDLFNGMMLLFAQHRAGSRALGV
jgi:hypothetical protein